jgi:hypothetical protein
MQEQETNDIIPCAPPEGRPRMDFSSIDSGKIDQPKVIKVWTAYYRWDKEDTSPVLDDLWVEIEWNGSKDRERKTLKYAKVMEMDGGEDAVAEFGIMF